MLKSALAAAVLAFVVMAVPAFGQPAVVADEPVAAVVADEPVVVATDLEIVVEPKTWLDWVQEGAFALLGLFGAGAAGAVILFIFRTFPGLTKSLADSDRVRIQEIILNGLYWAVGKLGPNPDPRSLKSATVEYTRLHADEYYKRLGVDPAAVTTKDSIEAQADRMLNDPAVPTPPSITPPAGKAVVVAAVAPLIPSG